MFTFKDELAATLAEIDAAGLTKHERVITTPQGAHIATTAGDSLNFCANNYLGLAGDPRITQAAHEALDRWGFGLSSVRFICGTQTPTLSWRSSSPSGWEWMTPSCSPAVLTPTAPFLMCC